MARPGKSTPSPKALTERTVDALLAKLRARGTLEPEDYEALLGVVETWAHLTEIARGSDASIDQIRGLLGLERPRTRSTRPEPQSQGATDTPTPTAADQDSADRQAERRRDEHGRSGPGAFKKLAQAHHTHVGLASGDECPECARGRVYKYTPSVFTTITGQAPLVATRHTVEALQCNLCKAVFKAPLPEVLEADGISGHVLYSFSAVAIVATYRFFGGLPMHRQQTLQAALGIPVPDASIWDLCERLADILQPIRRVLVEQAAQAKVFYGDDTGATVLDEREKKRPNRRTGKEVTRTGCHTTCVIAVDDADHALTLFFTGIHHTGEVLDLVLAARKTSTAPIFMGDCIASNTVTVTTVFYAGCNAHAVRRFKDLRERYPAETDYALTRYRSIYDVEAECVASGLSGEARRDRHADKSLPLLRELCDYGHDLFEQRKVEPNSDLGQAFTFILDNERRLSAFTRHPHAPLDNNRCERELRICVRLRETSRFFRNAIGAGVADTILTVGATAQAANVNLFDYFVAVQRHRADVREHPDEWVPWRYQARVRQLTGPPQQGAGAQAALTSA